MKRQGTFVLIAMILAMLVNLAPAPQAVKALSPGVVISQVYGGGGNTGATYTHDFVELFNRGTSPVSLAGWSIQYASATGTGNFGASATALTELPDVTLLPGQYFLIQEAPGTGGTTALPTPDVIDATPIAMSGSAGKVALVNSTASLGCNGSSTPCSPEQLALIIDLVGWGTANFYETAPAAATTNTTAVIRNNQGCMETDNNSTDFSVDIPIPRNTATQVHICPVQKPVINEFSASTTSTDVEYVEIFGSPNSDYSAYTFLALEGDSGETTNIGRIDNVISVGTTDANGLYLANLAANTFENGTISFLLVSDFTSTLGIDLDTNDDGDLEAAPWSEIADTVAVNDGGLGDITYGMVVLTPNYDGLSTFAPGGASRIPDGNDTNSITDWVRNDFDLAGIPGYTGTPIVGEALNTPGASNQIYTPPVESAPEVASTTPANAATNVPIDSTVTITFSEPVTVTGSWFGISCTTSGAHTATVTDADPLYTLALDASFANAESCTVTIYAAQVTDDDTDDPPDNMAADYSFTFNTVAVPEVCGDPFTPIYTIQGDGATTPLLGQELATEGIVVGDFQTNASVDGTKNGFYIQDATGDGNTATSDGIFVYSTLVDVLPGDHVRVRGKAAEYTTGTGSLTQVSTVTQIWVCSTGNSISPTQLSLPVASDFDYEDFEGMLVTYPQDLVISEYFNFDRYGEIVLTSRRHTTPTAEFEPGSTEYLQAVQDYLLDKITLDDGRTSQNPDPAIHPNGEVFNLDNLFRGGDLVTNATGILDFYQSLYRVQPIQGADYTPVNIRPVAPTLEGDLQVASFNVLNYFLTIDEGPDICGPLGNLECRGADTLLELERQRAKILAALSGMNADVYGLMEIQNDQDQSVADLVAGLNDIFGAGAYNYIATGYIGTDAIKQAIIYKTATVTPAGAFAILDETVDARFLDDYNRPVLAQSFTDNLTGSTFTVAVNHLKSKGSDCLAVSDPDLGDGQGNCNVTRTMAAEALVDWLATDPTASGASESLIIGDLNSYDKEDPIDAVLEGPDDILGTADDYTDLVFDYLGEYAYGYVFDGQTGYLDHALANPTLADNVVGATFWHINADEPDLIDYDMTFKLDAQDALYAPDAYRSSDHDPVIVSLSLDQPYEADDDIYATPMDMPLIVEAPGVMSNDSQANIGDTLSVQLKLAPDKGCPHPQSGWILHLHSGIWFFRMGHFCIRAGLGCQRSGGRSYGNHKRCQ